MNDFNFFAAVIALFLACAAGAVVGSSLGCPVVYDHLEVRP